MASHSTLRSGAKTLEPLFCLFVLLVCGVTSARCEEPTKVTLCQLKHDPPAYNHKMVEVTGFVSHASEDFSLFDPDCPTWPGIWLEYGGTMNSGTVRCCRETPNRQRAQPLTVEDIPIPLLINQQFDDFDRAIQPPFRSPQNSAVEHATLVGRFFAGELIKYPTGSEWSGYGHMGCCTLLAVQEIKDPDTKWRSDLAYIAPADFPDTAEPGSCQRSFPIQRTAAQSESQKQAESGARDWAFDDPRRVALDALVEISKMDRSAADALKQTQESQGRKVFEWKVPKKSASYMIVVSRPYWLSFYAHDPNRVAWVVTAAYESSCGKKDND